MRTAEEEALLEEGRIDQWIAGIEAGDDLSPSPPISGEWATVQEVAARHRVTAKTIRKHIHDGRLKAVDHAPANADPRHRRYRIHRDDETAWIAAKGEKMRQQAVHAKPKTASGRSFKDLITK
jgi:excisionase family DNA binding protein